MTIEMRRALRVMLFPLRLLWLPIAWAVERDIAARPRGDIALEYDPNDPGVDVDE